MQGVLIGGAVVALVVFGAVYMLWKYAHEEID